VQCIFAQQILKILLKKKKKKSACAGDCFAVHKNALKFGLGDNDEKKNLSIIKIIFKKKKNNIT
jgi:hypothetical protein